MDPRRFPAWFVLCSGLALQIACGASESIPSGPDGGEDAGAPAEGDAASIDGSVDASSVVDAAPGDAGALDGATTSTATLDGRFHQDGACKTFHPELSRVFDLQGFATAPTGGDDFGASFVSGDFDGD